MRTDISKGPKILTTCETFAIRDLTQIVIPMDDMKETNIKILRSLHQRQICSEIEKWENYYIRSKFVNVY